MAKKAVKKVVKSVKRSILTGADDYPRVLYHKDGAECIFTSAAAFADCDDGKWATSPGVHGRETLPGPKESA